MQRLKDRYPDSRSFHVLVNQEAEVLLLLDNRHVKHEKDNLAYLSGILDKTNKVDLDERDVVSHVYEVYPYLYSEDIEKNGCGVLKDVDAILVPGGFGFVFIIGAVGIGIDAE